MQLHEKYQAQGLEVITVSVDGRESSAAVSKKLQELSMTTTNWCLAEAMSDEVQSVLEFNALPTLKVYDRAGRVWETFLGHVDRAELETMIQQLLARK